MTKKQFKLLNSVRLWLIDKKYNGDGIDETETAELERLERETGEYMAEHHPRDNAWLDEMHERILALRHRRKEMKPGNQGADE